VRLTGARKETGGTAAPVLADSVGDDSGAPEPSDPDTTFLPEAERIANQLEALAQLLAVLRAAETQPPDQDPPTPEPRLEGTPDPAPAKEKKRGRLGKRAAATAPEAKPVE